MADNARSCLSDCSEARESQSLLQRHDTSQLHVVRKKCACLPHVKYRLPVISDKGAIVVIVWNVFFSISVFTCGLLLTKFTTSTTMITLASSAVLYPVIGWLADTRFGKYKFLSAGFYLLLIAIILESISIFILPPDYLLFSSLITLSLATACYFSCIFPFATDQSVGASAEQLSFTFHWMFWGVATGYSIASFTFLLTEKYQKVFQFFLAMLSFLIAFVFLQACHHLVMTTPKMSNPIKLIAQVLNYARKHKYPERRSALTYWEEDYPSRLDLGKEKYGGPFTFEEVEDVKTVSRLIPLLVCTSMFHMEFWQQNPLAHYYPNCMTMSITFLKFESDHPPFYPFLLLFIGLPIYYFQVFPFFQKNVVTIIRRIGAGMFLMVLTSLACAIVHFVVVIQSEISANVTCTFNNTASIECPTSFEILYTITAELSMSLGYIITLCGMFEFIIAQSPQQTKGFLLCICTLISCVFVLASLALHKLLTSFPIHLYPNCLFYYYMFYFIIGTFIFILYVLVAKQYRLRIRDDIVPYHMIAEAYFEREQANRSAYIRAQQLECSDEEYWRK